jgi:tripartite motif-containing protein 71
MPFSIAFDQQDNMYVADSGNDRIQIFDPAGQFVAMWGKKGSGAGEFNFHRQSEGDAIGGIAIDAQGNIYVVDTGNHRIQKFNPNGKFLLTWGSQGVADGQFGDPLFIAVDRQGNVYVDDDYRDGVQKFDSSGKFLLKWGGHGTGDGQFDGPGELTVDAHGNVYVTDFGNNRVEKFDSSGKFLLKWGGQNGQFDQPSGVVVDAQGNLYVSNGGPDHGTAHHWVQKFTADGRFLGKWGSYGTVAGEFIHPYGLGIDGKGNIYVVDTYNERIQKFRPR